MRKTYKILSVILAVLMVFSIMPITASAEIYSGTCGDNLTWTFDDETGTLTILGTGAMYDFAYDYDSYSLNRPWEYYIESIKEIVILGEVTSIGSFAFDSCNNLTEVMIGNSVEIIGISAFAYCGSLTEVIIPDSVKTICDAAFYWCEKLSNVIIGNNVKTIGESAFATCNNLTHIRIPDSVETIGMTAFCNHGLISMTVDENNLNYSSDEYGVLFNKDKTVLIQYPVNHPRTNYTIPDGVTHVLYCAFISCNGLTSITIPDSVIDITLSAFNDCKNIADVYYKGTEEQWNLIRIEPEGNEYLLDANIHFFKCNHSYSNWLITVESTCTENGLETRMCAKCSEGETRTISKTGHMDNNGNGYCDGCEELLDPTVECSCNCHKSGITKFFFDFILFFQKLFGLNKDCACGVAHY